MPERTPTVEWNDSRATCRVVVLDRLIERLALVGEILAQLVEIVGELLTWMMPRIPRAFAVHSSLQRPIVWTYCEATIEPPRTHSQGRQPEEGKTRQRLAAGNMERRS